MKTNSEKFNGIYGNYKSAAAEFRGKVCNAESCFANMNAKRSMEKHSPVLLVKVHRCPSTFSVYQTNSFSNYSLNLLRTQAEKLHFKMIL